MNISKDGKGGIFGYSGWHGLQNKGRDLLGYRRSMAGAKRLI